MMTALSAENAGIFDQISMDMDYAGELRSLCCISNFLPGRVAPIENLVQ